VNVYLHLDGEYLKKNKEIGHQAAIQAVGEEDVKGDLLFEQVNGTLESYEVDVETGRIEFGISTPVGYIGIKWHPETEELTDIVGLAVKKMNKLKAAFEALKKY